MRGKKIRYALIGAGRISVNHIKAAIQFSAQMELVAICDLNSSHVDIALEKSSYVGRVAKYQDYKEMLRKENIQLVAIATDSGQHASIGLFCLMQGCHVIMEKPMAMSVEDADKLMNLAVEKNLLLTVCHQNRYNPAMQKLQEALKNGRFGKLSHGSATVRWSRNEGYYQQAPWRGKWSTDGGCLMNQCIHNLDLILWLLGDVEEVFAHTANRQHPYIEGEDMGLALLHTSSGIHVAFEGTVNVFPHNLEETVTLFGESGTVRVGGTAVNEIEIWKFADATADEERMVTEGCSQSPPNVYGYGHFALYEDVLRCLFTGDVPCVTALDGKRAVELVLAIYKSQKSGEKIKLPLKKFSTLDMAGYFHSGF